jgi:hypothetical protein
VETMKNVVFLDVALCRSCLNRRFGGTSVNARSTSKQTTFFIVTAVKASNLTRVETNFLSISAAIRSLIQWKDFFTSLHAVY